MEKIKWEEEKNPNRLKQPVHFGLRHIKSEIAKKSSQTQRVLMSVYWLCSFFFPSIFDSDSSTCYLLDGWVSGILSVLCNFSRNFIRIIFDYVRS